MIRPRSLEDARPPGQTKNATKSPPKQRRSQIVKGTVPPRHALPASATTAHRTSYAPAVWTLCTDNHGGHQSLSNWRPKTVSTPRPIKYSRTKQSRPSIAYRTPCRSLQISPTNNPRPNPHTVIPYQDLPAAATSAKKSNTPNSLAGHGHLTVYYPPCSRRAKSGPQSTGSNNFKASAAKRTNFKNVVVSFSPPSAADALLRPETS